MFPGFGLLVTWSILLAVITGLARIVILLSNVEGHGSSNSSRSSCVAESGSDVTVSTDSIGDTVPGRGSVNGVVSNGSSTSPTLNPGFSSLIDMFLVYALSFPLYQYLYRKSYYVYYVCIPNQPKPLLFQVVKIRTNLNIEIDVLLELTTY